jgi:phosphopantetheine adenylyltransferase
MCIHILYIYMNIYVYTFIGSFNPLHEGHVAMVIAALKKMTTDNNSEINKYNDTNENLNGQESENSMTTKISKNNSKNFKFFNDIPVIFEISAINADKPPIPHDELIRRIRQFNPYTNEVLKSFNLTNIAVSITTEPFFLQKSDLFRNCKFLIGIWICVYKYIYRYFYIYLYIYI